MFLGRNVQMNSTMFVEMQKNLRNNFEKRTKLENSVRMNQRLPIKQVNCRDMGRWSTKEAHTYTANGFLMKL